MTQICLQIEKHSEKIAAAKLQLGNPELILEISDIFAALGNPTRLSILYALSATELCTCDLAEIVGLSDSAISHQLRILRDRKLIAFRKSGKNVFYRLKDSHVAGLLSMALEHLQEGTSHE